MKSYLFLILSISVFWESAYAQTKVIDIADTSQFDLKIRTLNKQYPVIEQLFSSRPRELQDIKGRLQRQFQTFYKQNDFGKYKVGFQLQEYIEPTGQAAYVLVEWSGEAPDSTKQTILRLLDSFYHTKQEAVTANVRFRNAFFYTGNVTEKRSVRSKPGSISTLEAAQKTTRPDTVKILYFNQLALKSVPDVVYRFPNLAELDLSKNSIKTLPARLTADLPKLERLSLLYNLLSNDSVSFASNKHLKALNIQGNELTLLPATVRLNRRLESLWLGNNRLKTADFRGLRRLTDLNIYNAELAACPPTVAKLRRLKVLDLYYNNITELPARLSRLRKLEQLAVSHNKLKQLPEGLSRLRRLQVLYAHHNEIGALPDRFDRFRSLRLLDLGYNFFSTTPLVLDRLVTLEELDLNSNNLQELSPGLLNLLNLKKLYLRNNPITAGQGRVGSFTQTIQQLEARKTEVFH